MILLRKILKGKATCYPVAFENAALPATIFTSTVAAAIAIFAGTIRVITFLVVCRGICSRFDFRFHTICFIV